MRLVLCLLLAGCVTSSDDRMLEGNDVVDPGPLEPAEPQGDFAAFIACIHYDDFVASNMADAWSTVGDNCTTCHTNDSMFSNDPVRFFDDLKHRTYVQVQFFTWDRTTETVEVNEETIPRIGKAVAPYAAHPKFDAHKGIQATFDLHERTNARLAAGTCQ
jgi:hypothetical protein